MTKPTIASLSVTVAELHREVVALRAEVAALKRPAAQPAQPQRGKLSRPILEIISWMNANAPRKSYTFADMAEADKLMS